MSAKKAYAEKLKDPRWQKKRLKVLERDGWACANCRDTETSLQVHHKAYRGEPWEASDNDLETLCEECHAFVSGKGDMVSTTRYLGAERACAAIALCMTPNTQKSALDTAMMLFHEGSIPDRIRAALTTCGTTNQARLLDDVTGDSSLAAHARQLFDAFDEIYLLYSFEHSLIRVFSGFDYGGRGCRE